MVITPATFFKSTVDGGGGSSDPDWSDVTLLLHMEGADEGTSFTDSSDSSHTVTAVGDAHTESDQMQFGSTSYRGDGAGDWLAVTNSLDFDLGLSNDPFTLEFFARVDNTSSTNVFASRGYGTAGWNGSTGFQYMLFTQSGRLYWQWWTGSGVQTMQAILSTIGMSANTWYHFAISYDGTWTSAYFNGTRFGTDTSAYAKPSLSNKMRVGGSVAGHSMRGYMDDFRMTKGTSRYTGSTITVPTSTFPDS